MDPCAKTYELPEGYDILRSNPGWDVYYCGLILEVGFKTENMARIYAAGFDRGLSIGIESQ
jgi:hypothetical protein